ncbi:Beta-barrel assembly machine subunit BamD [Verrucomicrobium sp. GAS474]|uniref:outer membrane protein assembly factor BamD n=1 Tax=Verrucomicrobium sp. GAS474 TaxID=1882831 RepID=UPI000879DDE7|nr:outer membrane protein assembly factor BamD [Verrucomicrobium sp. GAS474]SDU22990.1 Beta-barrel assembly machine subunit BamD [Verrucomicrobium sp. GAS474]
MGRRFLLFALLGLGAALSFPVPAGAALVWRSGEGWVDESSGAGLSASSSRDQLEIAKKLEADQKFDDALKAYRILVRKWPLSFFAPEAQFKIGFCLEKKADFWNAYKAYQKMIQKYPASTFFEQALDREFAIGNLYLAGEPQRLMRIPLGPSMDRTAEIFENIIKAAPYGEHAAEAQFKIGLAREKQKKFPDAVASYTKILDKYPGHPVATDAQYQIGYAWYIASREPEYDQSAAQKAIEAFEDFIVRYPNSEKVAAANTHIALLKGKETQGSFNIARFYEKDKQYKAAYIYYNDVIQRNPDSAQAKEARKKVEQLRPLVGAGTTDVPMPTGGEAAPPAPSPAAPSVGSPVLNPVGEAN